MLVVLFPLIASLSFLTDNEKARERPSVVSAALVGSILFHAAIVSTIPPVVYLVPAGKFVPLILVFALRTSA